MVIKLRKTVDKIELKTEIVTDTAKIYKPIYKGDCYHAENLKTTYNIALLLPFALDDASKALDAAVETDPSTFECFNYMQFYAGFMLAADSLEKFGLHAKIQVLDADKLNDTLTIRQALRKPGMDKMDLLVGPMYASSFTIAARFAKKHEIGIVNPLSHRENIADKNPYVIKSQVSGAGISARLASFIKKNYPGANIISVQNDKKELKIMAEEFATQIKADITNHSFTGTLQEVVFANDQMAAVTKKLKTGAQNIVIMFSNSKTAVPNFVSLLNPSAKLYDLILIGMDGWDELDLETEFLVNLNYHQIATNYIDYGSEATQQFITRFKNKYGVVPLTSNHAFLGYDIGWYFLTSLMWYGDNYLMCLPGSIGKGLQYNFDFRTSNPGDGLLNWDVDILKLQDFKMVPVE
jgi:ABC-type branched-subunit amino acid transport system substrate-binding protein